MFLSKLVLGFRMALDVRVGKYSIHSKESISFMEQLCPNDLLSVVKNELQFDFKETPPPYFEPNNKSCLQNLPVTQSQVQKWLEQGIVYRVKLFYSQNLKDSKTIMKRFGVPNISEKSFKASGVTTLLDKNTSLSLQCLWRDVDKIYERKRQSLEWRTE